jgi:hypothetical protein
MQTYCYTTDELELSMTRMRQGPGPTTHPLNKRAMELGCVAY